ncbi:MAG: TonB-dependent receptor [Bacteroidetes Order II. Incertae sedis bacterium]|mgnify:FL=1|nr:TonB-dependent receptor [Bacteroidetes Order II. bacterium]MBT6581733.1 TonB-dependent receptor [Bacteroidetes Order II. bacterium]MBT7400087.1 TonB-dependent receptor [Bacteroidetes Order II. bacterium]
MSLSRLLIWVFAWVIFLPVHADAQVEKDSLASYDLSEIVIGGQARQEQQFNRVYRVGLARLASQDRPDVAGVLRQLPSAHIQTNSRGETLVYIRGVGERQVAVFLDGAPLNIPWDNRIDLSLVPSTVLGDVSSEQGAVSGAYGPNVSGGVINLQSRRLGQGSRIAEVSFQGGSFESRLGRGMFAHRGERSSILIGGSHESRSAYSVPNQVNVPFDTRDDVRVNTDRRSSTGYVRFEREYEKGSIGLTLLHADAEKGVAPEGHLDPLTSRVRYWRYPVWQNSMAIVSATRELVGFQVFSTGWMTRFRQRIDQYTSATYDELESQQRDTDLGAGARFVAERRVASLDLRNFAIVSTASHDQIDTDFSTTGKLVRPEKSYRQRMLSVGSELASGVSSRSTWIVGASLDIMQTPETGDKPGRDAFVEPGFNLEGTYPISESVSITANAGSKTRFPTMRELFGTALNRFELNEALKSERTWMAESGIQKQGERLSFDMVAFVRRTTDTIDQTNVVVGERTKRKRINLDGSRTVGIEASGIGVIGEHVSIDGHATWLRPISLNEDGNRHLTEKPEVLITLNAEVSLIPNLKVQTGLVYTGVAYGLAEDNSQVRLPTSTVMGARLSTNRYFSSSGMFLELYAGVDNITNAVQLPQLGLPAPGRSARFGINLSY